MNQHTLFWKISRHTGLNARYVAKSDALPPLPPPLPVGHPHMGLRNKWYIVAYTPDLGDEPIAIRALGEDLVIWRDGDGVARTMRDYCPHRGARLSLGDVVDGDLQCWYHAWRFDGSGQCTSVPTQGGKCSLQRRLRIEATYPTQEHHGYVFAWIGELEPDELVLPFEMTDDSYAHFYERVEWAANWTLALENLADLMHAPFLHSNSLTLGGGIVDDRVRVDELDDGFRVSRMGQQGVNFDTVDIILGPLMYCRLDIPYPSDLAAGPGPDLRILGFVTPIDDTHTLVHFPRFRQVEGWQRKVWQTLFRLRLRGTHLHVLNQDKFIIESQRSIGNARDDEHPAQSDKGVIRLRKEFAPLFEAQLDALRARGIEVESVRPAARQSFRAEKQAKTAGGKGAGSDDTSSTSKAGKGRASDDEAGKGKASVDA